MFAWRKRERRGSIDIQGLKRKTFEYDTQENEIIELRKYMEHYCPYIPEIKDGIYSRGRGCYHNRILKRALSERINSIMKQQAKLKL